MHGWIAPRCAPVMADRCLPAQVTLLVSAGSVSPHDRLHSPGRTVSRVDTWRWRADVDQVRAQSVDREIVDGLVDVGWRGGLGRLALREGAHQLTITVALILRDAPHRGGHRCHRDVRGLS